MNIFTIEKVKFNLPEIRNPNTLYLVLDQFGKLDMYVTDDTGAVTVSNKQVLYTTPEIEIINNRILLPSRPDGEVLFGMMQVFDEDGVMTEYKNISVYNDTFKSYAVLEEVEPVAGYGVVSYLTRVEV